MVPALLIIPLLTKLPVEVMSMVPVALFVRVWPLLTVTSPLMVTVFVDPLVREPPVPIISLEPSSIVKVPVVSVKSISSVTVTAPSMIMVSSPAGVTPSLQFKPSDQSPVIPPIQVTVDLKKYASPTPLAAEVAPTTMPLPVATEELN